MAYLIHNDYLKQIQEAQLSQLVTNDERIRVAIQQSAQAEAISYLRQKYDISMEFTDTTQWVGSKVYNATNRVYIDANAYVTSTTYAVGNYVVNEGNVYKCTTITTGVFDPTKWSLIGAQYDLFYAKYPVPLFDVYGYYQVNDEVFWQGKKYKCKIQTQAISHDTAIQYHLYSNIPLNNVFPTDTVAGAKYWQVVSTYTVPANTDILDTDYWTKGDNRDQQMLLYFVDIALYHLHSRIAPRNIPQLRIDRYHSAIDWLKMCGKGEVTPNLPLIQPRSGSRIRFGSVVKNVNSY